MKPITKVPLLDLTRFDPAQLDQLRAAFERVLLSGYYIMGPEVDGMEREFAAFLRAGHAIGVSSGTDALLLALMSLGIGPGDEVICPTYTFFATAGSIWRTGGKPVFVDIDPRTYNCTAELIERAVTARTKAIMPVHLYGQCCDMDRIMAVAQRHGLKVIEDAAQAIGATWKGKPAGTFGTFGCFSFFPSKNLGCLGDGGLVTTNDAELAEHAKVMRVHGGKPKYVHKHIGANFRIDALQAALLRVKLPYLPAATAARQRNAALYTELLRAGGVAASTPHDPGERELGLPDIGSEHIVNQYVVRVGGGRRDAVREQLQQRGIGSEIYYPIPLHLQECFASLGHKAGDFPHSEQAANQTLALPVFPELTEAEIRHVADGLVAACRG